MSGIRISMAEIAAKAGKTAARVVFNASDNPKTITITEAGLAEFGGMIARLLLEEVERIESERRPSYVPNGKAP